MKPRFTIWIIIILTLLCGLVLAPKIRIQFSQGPVKIDTYIGGVDIPFGKSRLLRDNFKLNLDLQGGTSLLLQVDMIDVSEGDRDDALASSKQVIERRINAFGVEEPVIQTSKTSGEYRIIVDLPGVKDVDQAKKLVGQTAKLEFKKLKQSTEPLNPEADPFESTGIGGQDMKKAQAQLDPQTGQWVVGFELNSEGAKKFGELTGSIIGQPLAIFLDDQPVSAPTVQSEITDRGQITGNFTPEDAKELAIQLNAGALVAPIHIVEERTVGATLGSESVVRSVLAGIVGFLAVAIFMIGYYRFLGLLAVLALIVYIMISLAIFKFIPITLGLAGIAGFVLSVGMAVDANILVFERMKEELSWGKSRLTAIEAGFSRAFTSIRDSNFSSLITSFILFQFGTGLVKGFAVTLALGILVSMFTALFVTKTFLKLIYARKTKIS